MCPQLLCASGVSRRQTGAILVSCQANRATKFNFCSTLSLANTLRSELAAFLHKGLTHKRKSRLRASFSTAPGSILQKNDRPFLRFRLVNTSFRNYFTCVQAAILDAHFGLCIKVTFSSSYSLHAMCTRMLNARRLNLACFVECVFGSVWLIACCSLSLCRSRLCIFIC